MLFGPHGNFAQFAHDWRIAFIARIYGNSTVPKHCFRARGRDRDIVPLFTQNFDAVNDVKYNALDPYARTRSVYFQARQGLLEDRVTGAAGSAVSEDEFDSLFEEESN